MHWRTCSDFPSSAARCCMRKQVGYKSKQVRTRIVKSRYSVEQGPASRIEQFRDMRKGLEKREERNNKEGESQGRMSAKGKEGKTGGAGQGGGRHANAHPRTLSHTLSRPHTSTSSLTHTQTHSHTQTHPLTPALIPTRRTIDKIQKEDAVGAKHH